MPWNVKPSITPFDNYFRIPYLVWVSPVVSCETFETVDGGGEYMSLPKLNPVGQNLVNEI